MSRTDGLPRRIAKESFYRKDSRNDQPFEEDYNQTSIQPTQVKLIEPPTDSRNDQPFEEDYNQTSIQPTQVKLIEPPTYYPTQPYQ